MVDKNFIGKYYWFAKMLEKAWQYVNRGSLFFDYEADRVVTFFLGNLHIFQRNRSSLIYVYSIYVFRSQKNILDILQTLINIIWSQYYSK